VEIRELRREEHERWLRLRKRLWPETTPAQLALEAEEIVADPDRNGVLVAAPRGGEPVGFVEVAIRDWAEGCDTRPVGYLEAWYVDAEHRRSGLGRRLVEAAERWASARGCTEMGSDAELQNVVSHKAHRALGYVEVGPVVLFSKKLAGPGA
jgi:aminoglycoside 6'-N-acetyltransferase I